jgi:uncharacterized protein involved in tolerance to divalent cations
MAKKKTKQYSVWVSLHTSYTWIGEAENEKEALEFARESDNERQILQNLQEEDRSIKPYEKPSKKKSTKLRK